MKKLKSLNEHNLKRLQNYSAIRQAQKQHQNGIECPKCKEELWDSNPMVTLTSDPPQKNVHCPKCGYCGYRLA